MCRGLFPRQTKLIHVCSLPPTYQNLSRSIRLLGIRMQVARKKKRPENERRESDCEPACNFNKVTCHIQVPALHLSSRPGTCSPSIVPSIIHHPLRSDPFATVAQTKWPATASGRPIDPYRQLGTTVTSTILPTLLHTGVDQVQRCAEHSEHLPTF
jgi:hypothetical protein